jgi:hypothetical protein
VNDAVLMTLAVTTVAGLCFAIVLLLWVDRPEVLYRPEVLTGPKSCRSGAATGRADVTSGPGTLPATQETHS